MLCFFLNQYFFPHYPEFSPHVPFYSLHAFHADPSSISSKSSPSPQRFKPNIMHVRRNRADTVALLPPQDPPDPAPDPDPVPPLRRSTRITRPPDRYAFSHASFLATLSTVAIPTSYSQAMKHECWRKAMKEEFDALRANQKRDGIPCPTMIKPIGCK